MQRSEITTGRRGVLQQGALWRVRIQEEAAYLIQSFGVFVQKCLFVLESVVIDLRVLSLFLGTPTSWTYSFPTP
jgi:hypothetical protein